MSLDTLSNVKARLGITSTSDDALIGLLQDSADEWIRNYCQRDFEGGTFTEYHPGGSELILLRNFPVETVTSVKVDPLRVFGSESIVPPNRYVVHSDRGVIQSVAGRFVPWYSRGLVNANLHSWMHGPRMIEVIYLVATESVPADVREAYARLIGQWYRQVKTEVAANFQEIRQQKLGDSFVIFGGVNARQVPQEIFDLLQSYRVPNL